MPAKIIFHTIHGVPLSFTQEPGEDFYSVEADNYKFKMSKDEDGIWRVPEGLPFWLTFLEDEMKEIINFENI